jgi:hypothetical protein
MWVEQISATCHCRLNNVTRVKVFNMDIKIKHADIQRQIIHSSVNNVNYRL